MTIEVKDISLKSLNSKDLSVLVVGLFLTFYLTSELSVSPVMLERV